MPAFRVVDQEAMAEEDIRGASEVRDLLANPGRVISQPYVRLRMPTPVEEMPDLPESWVSPTPQNPRQASSQTEFIKTGSLCITLALRDDDRLSGMFREAYR